MEMKLKLDLPSGLLNFCFPKSKGVPFGGIFRGKGHRMLGSVLKAAMYCMDTTICKGWSAVCFCLASPPFFPILFVAEIFVNITPPDPIQVDLRQEHSLHISRVSRFYYLRDITSVFCELSGPKP